MSALNELQNYTFVSKYARWIEKENRRETWKEAVDRVKDMMHTMYADKNIKEDIDWAYDLMFKKKILGSQRCLQFGGEPILKRNSKLYNCTASYCDRLRFFQECFWLLLCGSGTGFSVQKHHVAKLPNLSSEKKDRRKGVKYIIEDSIEGWSDALGVLLSSYFVKPSESKFKEYKDQYIVFDYSKIRPKGSPLTSGVGKAPGFEPLQNGLEKIRELLDRCVANGQKKLRPIDAYDIVMHSSDAVLSGGVRRCIAKGSKVLVKGCSYKNIEDVAVGDMVSTINGWRKVVNTFNQGTQKTLTIQHQDGALQCTPNHRIAVLEYDQSIVWKYAKDLKENDTLCFVKNNNFTPVKSFLPTFSYKAPQNSTTRKNITIPTLDEDIAWLLGEIQGDGYVKLKSNSGEISVACEANAPEKAIKISKQLRRFGVNASIQQPKATDQCYKIRVKSKQLAQYFHGWLKQPKSTLIVPECIKKSDPKIKLAYLQGLLDADGHIGARCQQVVCTIYKEFAKELQSLLYSINIVSRFKTLSNKGYPEHWQQKYGLFLVNNEDRELFNCCQIGYKKFRPALIQKNSNSYSVGHFEYAKSKNLPKYWHQHVASNQKNIPYSTWNKVFGPSNIVPVNVAKIIDDNLTVETFDIEVEDDHNFICEGILVHNSASLALFSANDEEMAKAKTGNWYIDNPQRARSNNSALLLKNDTKYEDFQKLMESVKEFGEPGFIWGDSTEMVFNPCVEISLWPVNEKTGESGWQGCNLSTINCSSIVDENDFYERCKAAALIGTLQAGFTKLTYLGKNSEEIFEREALLGVSMTGIMEKHDLILTEKVLKAGAKIAVDTNKEFSKKIGINQAARVTCLKPEGCLTKDTTIVTNDGILSLEEIGDIHGDQWQNLENTTIATDKINQKASKFFINGHKPTKKILTSGGIELESTLNHKFRVITDEGKYEWKTAEELSIGDILPYKIGTYTGGCEQELYIPDIQRSKHASRLNTNINLPNIIDENFAWFIGLYTGDGSNHPNKYSIRIHGDINKQEHLVKAQNYIRSIGIDAKIVKYNQDSNDVRCALYITSRIFYEFLQHNGLLKNKSHDISIPLNIRKSKSSIISAFIDGYGSADGCTKGHTRSFCTTSKLMATQLVQCLRGIGIDCKTRLMPPTSTSYGSSMRYWIQERLGRSSKNVNKSQYSKYYQLLDQLGLYSFGVDFIVDIQDSSCDTYDISVEHEDHTYIANSYVSHNTSSSMLGTSSGIHPHHAKRYIRHVQANVLEPPYQYFKSYNPQACEKSSWSANNTDEVIKFPIEVPDGSKLKNQLPAVEMLAIVKDTQKNWVQSGKNRSLCTQDYLCHNVSNTVTVKPDEWEDVTKYIYNNRKYFAGISLIPQSGDKDYPQAPFTTVLTSREIVKEYGDAALWCSGLIELGLNAFDNNLWAACDYITLSQETDKDGDDKQLFSLKMRRFAKKYFNEDIKRLTYCMKDVYNWKIYTDLYDSFTKVDYTQLLETQDNTVGIEEISCAGGACLI